MPTIGHLPNTSQTSYTLATLLQDIFTAGIMDFLENNNEQVDGETEAHLSNIAWIEKQLPQYFPQGVWEISTPRQDDNHLHLAIVSPCFNSLSLVRRHQRVYVALQNLRHGAIHALSIVAKGFQENTKENAKESIPESI